MKGVNIRVISSREELETASEGIFHTLESSSGPGTADNLSPHAASRAISILDVGGGSTEISFYQDAVLRYWTSLDIGAVNLTEKFFQSPGPNKTDLKNLSRFVDSELETAPGLHTADTGPGLLVGTGGTITTLASMQLGLAKYDPAKIRQMELKTTDLDLWINRLTTMTLHEKHCISGLEPERADIILAGIVIIRRIMSKAGFSTIVTSDGGLLLGLLIRAIKKECISYAESSGPGGLYV
jgi:exopolyphosphatase/guanosine-5'-triphosphate,3'-diphosphate pyrophosphatase